MSHSHHSHFDNPAAIASYVENARSKVPGLADLHRMVMLLLAENVQAPAHMLVVGAGGGMETRALAEAQPNWHFAGVDPSVAMLDLARQTLGDYGHRVDLVEGTIEYAPDGPFDGAACLLIMHHLNRTERLNLLRAIHRRLKPGARFVMVEHSALAPDAALWMARSVAFGDQSGLDWDKAQASGKKMSEHLTLLSPAEEEQLLGEAGFADIAVFYAAFSFRGWVAAAGQP